jgi:hypothetical protein
MMEGLPRLRRFGVGALDRKARLLVNVQIFKNKEQGLRRHNRVERQATAYQSIQCTQSRPQAIYKQPPLLLDSSQLLDK